MMLIDGKKVAREVRGKIAAEVARMVAAGERRPHLAAVLVGNNGASETYVKNKVVACNDCGFQSTVLRLPESISESDLLAQLALLNADEAVDGYIVQLPLPAHINEQRVVEAIDYRKDVDGFHPMNVGRMSIGLPGIRPATPQGILMLLDYYGIETEGRHCVVLGRSNIVGRPVASLLLQKAFPGNCTVTVCHSATVHLKEITRLADILIVAIGSPHYVTADMVKDGAVIIDVGITRVADDGVERGYKLQGDVDYVNVAPKCSYITPVPGGVGPMTIASLMRNLLELRRLKRENKL